MADRGTVYSATASQYELDVYEHIQEPWAAFPGAGVQEVVDTTFETGVETWAPYGIAGDPPVNWSDQFDVPHGGDGFYMQEPNTTDKALQGAPNGRATVAGQLSTELRLTPATVSGSTAMTPAPRLLKSFDFTPSPVVARTSSIAATLTNRKPLSGDASGSSAVTGNLKIPGAYQQAVLVDSPAVYLTMQPDASGILYNHPSLGGQKFGSLDRFTNLGGNPSLVETEVSPSAKPGTNVQRAADSTLMAGALGAYTLEFWYQQTTDFDFNEAVFEGWAHTTSSGDYIWLRILVQSDGRVRAERGNDQTTPGRAEITSQFGVRDRRPHHIVAAWDPALNTGQLSLHVDGQLQGTQFATAGGPAAMTMYLAYFGNSSGSVDEAAFYSNVLPGTRAFAHYVAAWIEGPPISMRGTSTLAQPSLGLQVVLRTVTLQPRSYVPPSKLTVQRLSPLGATGAAGAAQVTGSLTSTATGPVVPLSGHADGTSALSLAVLDVYLLSLVSLASGSGCRSQVDADLMVEALFDIATEGVPVGMRREFT